MRTITTENLIGHMPFEPAPGSTNDGFRIDRYDEDISYLREELLVPHRKDFFFLAFVKRGNNRHWVDTVAYQVKPGHCYINNPQQVIMKEDTEPITAVAISFTPAFLAQDPQMERLPIILNKLSAHEIALNREEIALTDQLIASLEQEFHHPAPMQQQMLLAYMKTLLVTVSRAYTRIYGTGGPTEEYGFVCRFLKQVDANFTQLHEVAEYASLMNVSPGHLAELVKDKTGKSPIMLIHERIILEAKRLLLHTHQSVKEISYELGFEDDSYFVRFFKRCIGQTPAAYRSQTREMYH